MHSRLASYLKRLPVFFFIPHFPSRFSFPRVLWGLPRISNPPVKDHRHLPAECAALPYFVPSFLSSRPVPFPALSFCVCPQRPEHEALGVAPAGVRLYRLRRGGLCFLTGSSAVRAAAWTFPGHLATSGVAAYFFFLPLQNLRSVPETPAFSSRRRFYLCLFVDEGAPLAWEGMGSPLMW